jgi:hypothetical protein
LGEDVPDTGCMLAQHVGVDAQGYGWVGVAKPGGHHVHRDTGEKQGGRVQVTQIVQPGTWQRRGRRATDLLYPLISLVISAVTVSG